MKQKRMHKRQMLICLAVLAVLSWMTFHILFKDHSPEALYEVFPGQTGDLWGLAWPVWPSI